MKTLDKADIKRILVLKWSAMGDVVIATAAMEDLRLAFPEATLDLHTTRPFRALFEADVRFGKIMTHDIRGIKGIARWLNEIRKGRYDAIVDLQSNERSRALLRLLFLLGWAPRYRIGNHPEFPYNISSGLARIRISAFEIQKRALAAAGVEAATPRPALFVPEANRQNARRLQKAHGLQEGTYAVFFPGSQAAGFLKRWGAERYAALGRALVARGMDKIALIGGPDDVEECRRIEALAVGDWLVNLCGATQILDIVPLCADARLIVGNDTGTAHVASSTETPMLVICGPTDPFRVKPVGDQVHAIQADVDCRSCYKKHCEHQHRCMEAVTVEMVVGKLDEMNAL